MKRAPGTGGIRKLSGKRRKPYQAVVSAGRTWKDGKYVVRQKSLGVYATRREAQEALEEYNRYNYNIDLRSIRFSDVYDIIKEDFTQSVATQMRSIYAYCEPIQSMRMIDIRKMHLDAVAELAADKSKPTQRSIASLITRVYKWSMENDVIIKDYSPLLKFQNHRVTDAKKSYSQKEIAILIDDPTPINIILLYTGMRINELLNMRCDDVFEESEILCFHVRDSKTAAGKRIIPVHSKIEPMIRNMTGDYVIEPHLTYRKQAHAFKQWNTEHGINHTFHELRHTFATYTKSCGLDDYYRRALLGHSQNGLTDQVYTDALIPDLKTQIEKLKY